MISAGIGRMGYLAVYPVARMTAAGDRGLRCTSFPMPALNRLVPCRRQSLQCVLRSRSRKAFGWHIPAAQPFAPARWHRYSCVLMIFPSEEDLRSDDRGGHDELENVTGIHEEPPVKSEWLLNERPGDNPALNHRQ